MSVTINFHKLISPLSEPKHKCKGATNTSKESYKTKCNSGRLWLWSWVCVHRTRVDYVITPANKVGECARAWRNWEKNLAVYTRLPDSEVTSAAEMSVGVVFGRRPPAPGQEPKPVFAEMQDKHSKPVCEKMSTLKQPTGVLLCGRCEAPAKRWISSSLSNLFSLVFSNWQCVNCGTDS